MTKRQQSCGVLFKRATCKIAALSRMRMSGVNVGKTSPSIFARQLSSKADNLWKTIQLVPSILKDTLRAGLSAISMSAWADQHLPWISYFHVYERSELPTKDTFRSANPDPSGIIVFHGIKCDECSCSAKTHLTMDCNWGTKALQLFAWLGNMCRIEGHCVWCHGFSKQQQLRCALLTRCLVDAAISYPCEHVSCNSCVT